MLQKSKSTLDMHKSSPKLGDMNTPANGLHQNVHFPSYLSWSAVSKHDLDLVAKSPAHYASAQREPSESTPAMRFGTAAHTAILEPSKMYEEIAVLPPCDRRTKAGKELARTFEGESAGMTIISSEEMYHIDQMTTSVATHKIAGPLVKDAKHIEASGIWEHSASGQRMRCRPDIIHDDLVVDLKTAMDASRWAFSSSMHKYRYHVQAAIYLDGMIELGVVGPDAQFIFLVVEKRPPYSVAIYAVQKEDLDRGRLQYERDLMLYSQCKNENRWPGYSEAIGYIDLPIYSRREIDALTGNH